MRDGHGLYLVSTGLVDLPPKHGGAVESYVCDLAAMFPEARIISDGTLPGCLQVHSPIDRFPFSSRTAGLAHLIGGGLTAFAVARHVPRGAIVHLNEEVCGALLSGLRLGWELRVQTVHNPPPTFGGRKEEKTIRGADWRLSVKAARAADRVVALNEPMAKALEKEGVQRQNIRIVPLPIDVEWFRPSDELTGRGDPVLFVGRLEARKNPLLLASAVAGLNMTFVGIGSLYEQVMITALESRNIPRMFPTPTKEELRSQYQACQMLVLPSRLEVYPRVVLEAAASGLPCVLPEISLYKEFIDAGFVETYVDDVDLGDAILHLTADPERRRRMGKAAREFAVSRNSYGAVRERLIEVYCAT